MITVAILINGQPIYTRTAVNKGAIPDNMDVCLYEVDDGSFIRHDPNEGAVVLAKKMLDKIKESK